MPTQEEGVHQVPGEPSGRAGEPKQGPHRGAQVAQGALLPAEERLNDVRRRAGGGGAKIVIICCHQSRRGWPPYDDDDAKPGRLAGTRTTTTTTTTRKLVKPFVF